MEVSWCQMEHDRGTRETSGNVTICKVLVEIMIRDDNPACTQRKTICGIMLRRFTLNHPRTPVIDPASQHQLPNGSVV